MFCLFTPNCLFMSNWVKVRDSRRIIECVNPCIKSLILSVLSSTSFATSASSMHVQYTALTEHNFWWRPRIMSIHSESRSSAKVQVLNATVYVHKQLYYLWQGGCVLPGVWLSVCLFVCLLSTSLNKQLSYPQRKCASNVAILYGAGGISTWNRIGMDH